MTKIQVRDAAVIAILKVGMGVFKSKSTGEILTLDKFATTELFSKIKKDLAEKKISRRSVFTALEMKLIYAGATKYRDELHKFCYTYLDK